MDRALNGLCCIVAALRSNVFHLCGRVLLSEEFYFNDGMNDLVLVTHLENLYIVFDS
jgi:hypothetical protein